MAFRRSTTSRRKWTTPGAILSLLALTLMAGLNLVTPGAASASLHRTTAVRAANATRMVDTVGGCICASFTVPLAATSVAAYNASNYPTARLVTLIQFADRGMQTQDPVDNNVSGEMHSGDLVVATEYGIYWIDATHRGGLLSGEWPLTVDGSGNANFEYIVGTHNWGPNQLLPGSGGNGNAVADEGDAGLGVRVIGKGGTDGSGVSGKGTFDPIGTATQTYNGVQGYDQVFQYSGVLTQEYNGTQTISDNTGDTAQIQYVITYRFRNANDPTSTYSAIGAGHAPISDQYVNRVEVSLTPVNVTGSCYSIYGVHCINIGIFGIGDDLQHISSSLAYPELYMLSTKDTLANYEPASGCGSNSNTAAGSFATLCTTPPAGGQDFIQEPTTLPTTVPSGDETILCALYCVRDISYIHPSGFLLPARDSAVYNTYLEAIAFESQYIAANDPPQPWYNTFTESTGEDQLIQYF